MATGRIPVVVVAGGAGSGKSRLILQLRARCPPGERWAYLGNSVPETWLQRATGPAIPADAHFSVGGGCACCLAGPVFRTTLVRLLRAGPWHRLHIEVDPAGHPHRLTDQLRQPPFDQHLQVAQLLLTVRDLADLAGADGGLQSPPGPLDWPNCFLLRSGPASGTGALAARLSAAPPWPRLEQPGYPLSPPAGPGLAPPPGWRAFNLLQPDGTDGCPDLLRYWPAEAVAERRPFKALLAALAADAGVAGLLALIRTPRAWYRWRSGRGGGAGAFDFDEGDEFAEAETAWRLDSRVGVWLAKGAESARVRDRLRKLDLGLPDAERGS